MTPQLLFLILIALTVAGYVLGRQQSLSLVGGKASQLHSLPSYHGFYTALWCAIPSIALLVFWLLIQGTVLMGLSTGELNELRTNEVQLSDDEYSLQRSNLRNVLRGQTLMLQADCRDETSAAFGERRCVIQRAVEVAATNYQGYQNLSTIMTWLLVLLVAIGGTLFARQRIAPRLRARNQVENVVMAFLLLSSTIAILTTVGIVFSVVFESMRFFSFVSIIDFLTGTQWSPQIALRADQEGASGAFGAIPLIVGTLLISAIAMAVAVPVGLMTAIYLSEYASHQARAYIKPVLEILAGVPTVVYGFFAAITMAPFMRATGESMGIPVSSESALAAGLVMGMMIIPFVSSLSDDVIHAVPQAMRDGSYGLGATKSETIKRVILPAALPGIVGSILLAVSRALGETMIVVMAAGLAANLTLNPLETVTTVTVQIVTLLIGDQEFDSPKTLAAFALGLTLFAVTLTLNIIALNIVKRYREQYE